MVKRSLRMIDHERATLLPAAIMAVCASLLPAKDSESPFRDIAEGDELAAVAVAELNAYYAESPGFRYARAIMIDTAYLEKATARRDLEVREIVSILSASRHDGRVMEWNGTFSENFDKVALRKINGKFYGSYQANDSHYVITPYRSRGRWVTIALVYDGESPRCGVGMRAKRDDEEAAK